MKLRATNLDGTLVNVGDTITDFRGDTAILISIDRANMPGKSGKVTVLYNGNRGTYYSSVFNLIIVEVK